VDAPAELASFVRFTGLEEASDIQDKWDRVLAMLIQETKMERSSASLLSVYLATTGPMRQ
jgi:hypothetical protein